MTANSKSQTPIWIGTKEALELLKTKFGISITKPTLYKIIQERGIGKQPSGKWGNYIIDKKKLEELYGNS